LVVLHKMSEVDSHVGTVELSELESLSADGALLNAGEGLEQSASPLVDVFKGDVAPQWMDH
jgi:hypothetical protein